MELQQTLEGRTKLQKKRTTSFELLCIGFFKTYALKPCLFFNNLVSRMKFIPILSFYLNHRKLQLHH
jgi:hypothetical protein